MNKQLKGFMLLPVIIVMILSTSQLTDAAEISVLANQKFVVTIDGREVDFSGDIGSPMLLATERTFVPIRVISEYMGYDVDWSKDTWRTGPQLVWINNADTKVEITLNKAKALVNGRETYIDYTADNKPVVDSKAFLYKERTYVPLRFISEAFGADVKYERVSGVHHITITTKGKAPVPTVGFIEPKFKVMQYDKTGPRAIFFEVRVDNYKEYSGKDAVFSSTLTSHPHYNHYKMEHLFNAGEWVTLDVTNNWLNQEPRMDNPYFTIYNFVKSKNQYDLTTNKPQPLPKIDEIMTIRVKVEMNGQSKNYDVKVPFKGGVNSY